MHWLMVCCIVHRWPEAIHKSDLHTANSLCTKGNFKTKKCALSTYNAAF
jgi:hypothetical protein